jgi:hypothetical protein
MSMEKTEMTDFAEEREPIYFTPKRVSLVSDISSILSWVVLVGFVGNVIVQIIALQAQLTSQNLAIATLLHEPSFYAYLFVNLIIPLLTGLVFFLVLQAAAVGLNVMLEMDYNAHETKGKA